MMEMSLQRDSLLEEEDDCIVDLPGGCSSPTRNQNENDENPTNKRKKRSCFNLRKSLAWNNAFFTEQGFLNQQELSRLAKFSSEMLSDIPEEPVKSDGSGLYHPERKLFHNSPLRNPKLSSSPLSNKVDRAPGALATKTSHKLESIKGINKSLPEPGNCPRPPGLASQKRLSVSTLRNTPRKDLKIPKHSLPNMEQPSASGNLTAFEAKHSSYNRNRPEGALGKNTLPKGSTKTSKASFTCTASSTKTSANCFGKDVASKATTGSRVIPYPVPTGDTKTGKVLRNAHYSSGKLHNAQSHVARPSGLRMPSPSLGYFAQPLVSSSSNVESPTNDQPSNLHEASVPFLKKYGDTRHNGVMRPSFEPALTVRIPEVSINCMNSFMPTAESTTSHSSLRSKKEFNKSIVENFQASPLSNSEMGINTVGRKDNSTEHQHAENAHEDSKGNILVDSDYRKPIVSELSKSEDPQQRISRKVDRVQCKENHSSKENNGRWLEKTISEVSIRDLDIKNSRCYEFNNSISSKGAEITDLSNISNISDCELKCEFETGLRSGSSKKLQKHACIEDFINDDLEKENYKAGKFEISQAPTSNSEMQNYGLSEAAYLVEPKIDEKLQESLKSSTSADDIVNCATMVQDNCLEVGNCVKTLLEEQQALEKHIATQVNIQCGEGDNPLNNICGLIGQGNSSISFVEDNDPVNLRCKEANDCISFNDIETSDLRHSRVSDSPTESELNSFKLPAEVVTIPLGQKSPNDSRGNILATKQKTNAVPFSDEWLAALEEVGEEILTRKTGAVQNSPTDKSVPEPGPWSPVKRKNIPEIGPFDCTKYTSLQ